MIARAVVATQPSPGSACADVYYGLLNEELFRLFVVDCGWGLDRFRRWATTVMIEQLTASP